MATGKTILVLEDDADEAFLLSRALQYAGADCHAEFVRDGFEAINYLQHKPPFANKEIFPIPTLAIVDIDLPGLNGLQFLRWVRSHPELSGIPVIILTNAPPEKDQAIAEKLGASAFFRKPANTDALYALVKKIEGQWLR